MLGGGHQVDKVPPTKKWVMFMYLKREKDIIHFTLHLFMETGIIQLEWERKLEKGKKKNSGKRIAVRKKQPIQRNSNSGRHL